MGSISRLSRDTRDHSSPDYRIYASFFSKSAASTFIDCYTPCNNTWNRTTSIPGIEDNFVLKDFAMVALNDNIYVIGGLLSPEAAEHDSPGEDEERAVPCVRRYNVRTESWDACSPMSTARFNFGCTVSNDRIYVAGGQRSSGRAEGISSTEVYDPALDQWRSLADMNMTRYNCVGVTWKGRIYAVGGFVGGRPFIDAVARSSAEVYNEKLDKWVIVNRMWDLDIPPYQIVAMNQKLFSSGDRLKPWKGHIELYDENEKIWNAVHGSYFNFNGQGAATGRLYLTMAPIGNQLYFLAGYKMSGEDSGHLRSEVHVFDTGANGYGWRSFDPAEEEGVKELCGHCCVLKHES